MMLTKKEPETFTYEEAAAYIEEIPKFTKKHMLEHTKTFLKSLGNPAADRKIVHVARYKWKRVCMCILTGHTYVRGEENRVLYIPSSCICK